ncbi:hypothetical protein L6164_008586 [Bauhinia variegata]|uniref:Uncharacterized protein n=1 Tax=Bauhinia variegata TaxID=167791 RepID=A0ACB9PG24_BAUVA|nr:hypothetical protein L6164_008586 [Bauhinia variegata]
MSRELNNLLPSQTQSTEWTRFHDKLFELALVTVPEDSPDRWEKIAEKMPGKSPEEMKYRYEALVRDVLAIESGFVEVPKYPDDAAASPERVSDSENQFPVPRPRKRGTPWSEEEHQRFLLGLEKYGKGDWRSISRNFVVTRSPTQVASHAQKYFLRQSSANKERRRASIHDITTVDPNKVAPVMSQVEQFLRQNSANNERDPVSTTVDPNVVVPVVPPAIGSEEDRNWTDNERRLVSIHGITPVDSNRLPPAIVPGENILHQNWVNNERTLAGIQDMIKVDSNPATPAVGQNWVAPSEPPEIQQWNLPYDFPDQMGGYGGYTNYGFH